MSNMIIMAVSARAQVIVTSLERGLMCSFTLKVKVEMDSNLPVACCYLSRLEWLNFKVRHGENMKFKSRWMRLKLVCGRTVKVCAETGLYVVNLHSGWWIRHISPHVGAITWCHGGAISHQLLRAWEEVMSQAQAESCRWHSDSEADTLLTLRV